MRPRVAVVWVAALGALAFGCELIAGLQDRKLEVVDASPDASTCSAPRAECVAGDATTCVDLSNDPNHCGSCTKTCGVPDAGPFDATSGNPDPGIPSFEDAGADAAYVHAPSAMCDAGSCGLGCSGGEMLCSGLCYDTANVHDHCGGCTTACSSGQWCHGGACCDAGMESCDGGCIGVLSDDTNCGACGVQCEGGTPTCVNGACTAGVMYTETLVYTASPATYCNDWNAFRAQLTGTYSSITMRGTFDPVGHTCTGAAANTLCQALHNGTTTGGLVCDGNTWAVGLCSGPGYVELNAKDGNICSCQSTAPTTYYDLRPCNAPSWGGVDTVTCNAPTQTDTVICQ